MKKISNYGVLLAALVLFSSCTSPYIEDPSKATQSATSATTNTTAMEVQASVDTKTDVAVPASLSLEDAATAKSESKTEAAPESKDENPVEPKKDETPAAQESAPTPPPEATPVPEPAKTPTNDPMAASTPAAAAPEASVTLVELDEIWKAAEFPDDYKSSYAFNYPDIFSFTVSRAEDVYSRVRVTDDDNEIVFEIRDIHVPHEDVAARAKAAFDFYRNNDWIVVNEKLLLRQIDLPTRYLHFDKENAQLYIMELPNAVVLLNISSKYSKDAHFVRQLLNSLKSAE